MLIVKCNKKISLFVQLFVCCDLFCLCVDIMYLLLCLGRLYTTVNDCTHHVMCSQLKSINGRY